MATAFCGLTLLVLTGGCGDDEASSDAGSETRIPQAYAPELHRGRKADCFALRFKATTTWTAGGPSRYTTVCSGATDDYPIVGRFFVMRHVDANSTGRELGLTPGPITLTSAPLGRDATYSTQRRGRFRFRLANGDTGTLILAPRKEDISYVLDPSRSRGGASLTQTRAECPFLFDTVFKTRSVWIWAGPTGQEDEVIVCGGFEPRRRGDGAIAIFSVGGDTEGRSFRLGGTGAVFFTAAPEGRDLPRRAIRNAVLRFRAANGRQGVVRLAPNPKDSKVVLLD